MVDGPVVPGHESGLCPEVKKILPLAVIRYSAATVRLRGSESGSRGLLRAIYTKEQISVSSLRTIVSRDKAKKRKRAGNNILWRTISLTTQRAAKYQGFITDMCIHERKIWQEIWSLYNQEHLGLENKPNLSNDRMIWISHEPKSNHISIFNTKTFRMMQNYIEKLQPRTLNSINWSWNDYPDSLK